MAETRPDPIEEIEDGLIDPECIYRMIALMCGTWTVAATAKEGLDDKDAHHRVMSMADCYMEYIDPLIAVEIETKT